MVTIYISGGSNCVLKTGWAPLFIEILAKRGVVAKNISVAASNSLMGFYRLNRAADLMADDVVIWGYSTGDETCFTKFRHKLNDLLRAVERNIIFCRDKGARFVPLIVKTAESERSSSPYFDAVTRLLSHYNLKTYDISAEFCRAHNLAFLDASHFHDGYHYNPHGEVVTFVAQTLGTFIDTVGPVPDVAPLYAKTGKLVVRSDFTGARREDFTNSVLSVPVYSPDDVWMSLPPFENSGRVAAIIVKAMETGGGMLLRLGPQELKMSLSDHLIGHRPALRSFSLAPFSKDSFAYKAGDVLQMRFLTKPSGMQWDYHFSSQAPDGSRDGRVVSVLCEDDLPRRIWGLFNWLRP